MCRSNVMSHITFTHTMETLFSQKFRKIFTHPPNAAFIQIPIFIHPCFTTMPDDRQFLIGDISFQLLSRSRAVPWRPLKYVSGNFHTTSRIVTDVTIGYCFEIVRFFEVQWFVWICFFFAYG